MKESFSPSSSETEVVVQATPEELQAMRESYKKYREAEKAASPERARAQAETLRETNRAFIANRERNRAKGKEMSEEEFLLWEEDFAGDWERLQEYLRKGEISSSEQEADIEEPMFFTRDERVLHETIEAQACHYYHKRAKELREAIAASGVEDPEEVMKPLSDFYMQVNEHLRFKYMSHDDLEYEYGGDYASYDRGRTAAHNNTITALNRINDLARRFGTTPFTPRNFWTSYKDMKSQTPAESTRMRYDRDVVEEYYAIAFSDKEQQYARRRERADRGYWHFLLDVI